MESTKTNRISFDRSIHCQQLGTNFNGTFFQETDPADGESISEPATAQMNSTVGLDQSSSQKMCDSGFKEDNSTASRDEVNN